MPAVTSFTTGLERVPSGQFFQPQFINSFLTTLERWQGLPIRRILEMFAIDLGMDRSKALLTWVDPVGKARETDRDQGYSYARLSIGEMEILAHDFKIGYEWKFEDVVDNPAVTSAIATQIGAMPEALTQSLVDLFVNYVLVGGLPGATGPYAMLDPRDGLSFWNTAHTYNDGSGNTLGTQSNYITVGTWAAYGNTSGIESAINQGVAAFKKFKSNGGLYTYGDMLDKPNILILCNPDDEGLIKKSTFATMLAASGLLSETGGAANGVNPLQFRQNLNYVTFAPIADQASYTHDIYLLCDMSDVHKPFGWKEVIPPQMAPLIRDEQNELYRQGAKARFAMAPFDYKGAIRLHFT